MPRHLFDLTTALSFYLNPQEPTQRPQLISLGASVVLFSSSSTTASTLIETLLATGPLLPTSCTRALAVQSDAGSLPAIRALVAKTVDVHGKIDILVANAGVLPMVDLHE